MAKPIVIGRHKFLKGQLEALKKAFGIDFDNEDNFVRISHIENIEDVIAKAKEIGSDKIIIQGLPLDMIMKLFNLAKRENIRLYILKMKALGLYSLEEAEEMHKSNPENIIYLPPPPGERTARVIAFDGLYEIKDIKIVEERVA